MELSLVFRSTDSLKIYLRVYAKALMEEKPAAGPLPASALPRHQKILILLLQGKSFLVSHGEMILDVLDGS